MVGISMTNEQLGYVAQIIYDAYVDEGHAPTYLEEKHSQLLGRDKYQSLLYLHGRESLHEFVAKKAGVTVQDLRTTIDVLGGF